MREVNIEIKKAEFDSDKWQAHVNTEEPFLNFVGLEKDSQEEAAEEASALLNSLELDITHRQVWRIDPDSEQPCKSNESKQPVVAFRRRRPS